MKVGTKSILFGVHCWFIHPWFVFWGWWRVYGFPWDLRLWVAFFVHDLGYWGSPNMDGEEGEEHPYLGARIMGRLFDKKYPGVLHNFSKGSPCCQCGEEMNVQVGTCNLNAVCTAYEHRGEWFMFCLHHSRFLAKRHDWPFTKLCVADKMALVLTPAWLYLPMARATGEIHEYMHMSKQRQDLGEGDPDGGKYESMKTWSKDQAIWYANVQAYMRQWVEEHKDCRPDSWTPSQRSAKDVSGVWS